MDENFVKKALQERKAKVNEPLFIEAPGNKITPGYKRGMGMSQMGYKAREGNIEKAKEIAKKILGNERGSVGPAQGRSGAMKIAAELEPDDAMRETIAKMKPGAKLGKVARGLAKGAGVLGAGLGALEIADYELERLNKERDKEDEVAMAKAETGQAAKTKMKILKDKTGESLKNIKSLQASTKKNTSAAKASKPAKAAGPKMKSDEEKTKEYMSYMKKQPDMEDDSDDFGKAVEKAMDKNIKSEIKSGKYKDLKWGK